MARPFKRVSKIRAAIDKKDTVTFTWEMIGYCYDEVRNNPTKPLAKEWHRMLNSLSTAIAKTSYPTVEIEPLNKTDLKEGLDAIKEFLIENPVKEDVQDKE